MGSAAINAQDYEDFRRFLEESCGIVLGQSKQYLVSSRLKPLLAAHGMTELGDLVRRLQATGSQRLRAEVIDAMTTNETQWFRDVAPFALFQEHLLPEFARQGLKKVRIWSAACSSGQEPYSLSIALDEYRAKGQTIDGEIVGTDISPQMVARARRGEYSAIEVRRGLSPQRQQRYFETQDSQSWALRPEVMRRVSFRQHNLLERFAAVGRFDLILCRNVLIYFSLPTREDILRRMAAALNPGGYLMIGASESMPRYIEELEMVRLPPGVVYRRRKTGA